MMKLIIPMVRPMKITTVDLSIDAIMIGLMTVYLLTLVESMMAPTASILTREIMIVMNL